MILCHNCERIYLHNSQQLNSTYPCWQSPWYGDDECGVHAKLFLTLCTHLQQCVNGSMTVGCSLLLMPVHLSEDELGDHRKWHPPSPSAVICQTFPVKWSYHSHHIHKYYTDQHKKRAGSSGKADGPLQLLSVVSNFNTLL